MPLQPSQSEPVPPNLGLVCITVSNEIRYRTVTRKRLLSFPLPEQSDILAEIYLHNLGTLLRAIYYCGDRNIRLYRISSQIFPFADEPVGKEVLSRLQDEVRDTGKLANVRGVRLLIHPDQFVVLNSDSPQVVQNSLKILAMHAATLDYLEQPHSSWSLLEIHGGKGKRGQELIAAIRDLPPNIRTRLALENDEYIYSAAQILEICQAADVPMVFDAHHHVCFEKLESYEDASIPYFVDAAASTWSKPEWQVAHISNGREFFADRRHHDLITTMPTAYRHIPWIEVEAKGKELAIGKLQEEWLPALSGDSPKV